MSELNTQDTRTGIYENHGELYTVSIPLKVSQYLLASIIIDCLESGYSTHWCPKVRLRIPDQGYDIHQDRQDKVVIERTEGEVWNEYIARNVALGGTLTFFELSEDEKRLLPHRLTRKKMLKGMAKMFAEGHFVDRITGTEESGEIDLDMDGPMADVIIQYALFGEEVYG